VSNTKQAGRITAKISANPNPIYFGQGSVVISWETNDPAGGEVRVSTCPGDEKLVARARADLDKQKSPGFGSVGETVLCQFIGTAIPKYLDSSIAGRIVATPNPVPFGADVLISWGTNA
jgi:hypothetical protein